MDPICSATAQPLEAPENDTSSEPRNHCTVTSNVIETYQASPAPAPACSDPLPPVKSEDEALLAKLREHARNQVQLCKRTADLPGARQLDIKHHWIRTATKEAGMGRDDGSVPGNHMDLPYVTKVTVNDHSGEGNKPGSTCTDVPDVDADCVNRQLRIGMRLGHWAPTNQCQTFAAEVLDACKVKK